MNDDLDMFSRSATYTLLAAILILFWLMVWEVLKVLA